MIKIYYYKIKSIWEERILVLQMACMPLDMQTKISRYQSKKERQSRIIGKLMLLQLIKDFDLHLSLEHILYSKGNKAILSPDFDFNISHSGDMIVCAALRGGQIGIDIEQIRPIDMEDYRDYLTGNEWLYINKQPDRQKAFFEIWTRKEALIKACGTGLDAELNTIDVCNMKVDFMGCSYFLSPIEATDMYIGHLASTIENITFEIAEFTPDSFDSNENE